MQFQLGPITIDIGWLLAFFTGVFTGILIVSLWYLVAVIASLNKSAKKRPADVEDIDEKEIKWLIDDAHKVFKDKEKRNAVGYGPHLLNTTLDLSKDIATKFYPKSKYPFLELTIDESILLMRYVSNRLNEFLDKPLLKMLKGFTLRRLMTLNDAKVKFDNNLIVKTTNKWKVKQIWDKTFMALNVINPIYWFKRLVVGNLTNVILVKLGLVVISLTGEETYKIYSKKVFNEVRELDSGIEDLYHDIENAMKGDNKGEEE